MTNPNELSVEDIFKMANMEGSDDLHTASVVAMKKLIAERQALMMMNIKNSSKEDDYETE